MRLRVLAGAAVLATALATSACSGTPAGSTAPSTAPAVTTAPPVDPGVSGAPSAGGSGASAPAAPGTPATPGALATLPAEQCLGGTYRLVRFVAVGDGSTYGTGQGGDVTLAFDGSRYTLAGTGGEPVVVTLAGQSGDLRVDGAASGGWTLDGETATFTTGSTTGGGTLDNGAGGARTKLTMKQVDAVIGLSGKGQVACTAQVMTITLAAIRLELARA